MLQSKWWPTTIRFAAQVVLGFAAWRALAQDVSVVRSPQDSDMTVRLINLVTRIAYERSGESYFIVPLGRYSIQLLRGGHIAYQEAEYLGPDSPKERMVGPKNNRVVIGLPEGTPSFGSNLCPALETATGLVLSSFGVHDADLERRLENAEVRGGYACSSERELGALMGVLGGSYGVTPLGMVGLSIEFVPVDGAHGRPGASYMGAAADIPWNSAFSIPTGQAIGDLRNGITDVLLDYQGRPYLVCAVTDDGKLALCDSDGGLIAPQQVAALSPPRVWPFRAMYRFHIKTTPVDEHGVELDHWVAFVFEEQFHATRDKLEMDINAIEARLTQRIRDLEGRAALAPDARAAGLSVRSYPTESLLSLVKTTQSEIDDALKDATLQPLRRHFPTALMTVNNPAQPSISTAEAEKVIRELGNDVTVLGKAAGDLGVDLVFRTTPVETEGALLTFNGLEWHTPVISQGGVRRLYRGRYFITVSRDGYEGYQGWLDLLDDPKAILECDLVRTSRSVNGHRSSCSQKTQ